MRRNVAVLLTIQIYDGMDSVDMHDVVLNNMLNCQKSRLVYSVICGRSFIILYFLGL